MKYLIALSGKKVDTFVSADIPFDINDLAAKWLKGHADEVYLLSDKQINPLMLKEGEPIPYVQRP